jgi:photosystem II stability/assembly factor-like uncharacterized protein
MRPLLAVLVPIAVLACAPACKKKESGTKSGGGGGSWLIGRDGTMLRYDHLTGAVADYGLEVDADLLDIACRGLDDAWVVGELGTLLRTDDRAETWVAVDIDSDATLRGVAAAGYRIVWVVGDGVVLRSEDEGQRFTAIEAPAVSFTAVATTFDGEVALATTADGDIYRLTDRAERVHDGAVPLRSISMAASGSAAIAVGDSGLVLRSGDGGRAFARLPTASGAAEIIASLHGVQLSGDGDGGMVVGDGGAMLRIEGDTLVPLAPAATDGRALRSIHLTADGMGITVGDDGVALVSHDAGATWSAVELDTDATLLGVDDLHGEPHL